MDPNATLTAGRNIAIKVPPHLHEATVRFYRDVVGLKQIASRAPSVAFAFGSNQLWIDAVAGLSQAETWLELITDDIAAAAEHLDAAGVVRCDAIEPLPEGMEAFWISNPASIVHLVCKDTDAG
jgi:hypothetical protein